MKRDKRLNIILQVVGLGWMILAGGLLSLFVLWLRPDLAQAVCCHFGPPIPRKHTFEVKATNPAYHLPGLEITHIPHLLTHNGWDLPPGEGSVTAIPVPRALKVQP